MGIKEQQQMIEEIESLSIEVKEISKKVAIERAISKISCTMLGIFFAIIIARVGGLL